LAIYSCIPGISLVPLAPTKRSTPEVVAVVATNIEPMRPFIGQVGMFGEGPSGTLDDNADAQTALLDLMGRRP
jgi:hypothetical protein